VEDQEFWGSLNLPKFNDFVNSDCIGKIRARTFGRGTVRRGTVRRKKK